MYGDIKRGSRSDESVPIQVHPIQHLKLVLIILINSYIRTYKIPAIISNCCNNYGPFQFPEKIIPKMISNILNNKYLPIYEKVKTQENGYL